MAKTDNKRFMSILYIAVLFIFGIVFCVASYMAAAAISWIIGLAMIFGAVMLLVSSYDSTHSVATLEGLMAAAIGALGILFIVRQLGSHVYYYIPYILIVWGALIVVDAILFRVVRSNKSATIFALEFVLGVCSIVLGVLLLLLDDFAKYGSLVFGIVLIVSAIFQLYLYLGYKRR